MKSWGLLPNAKGKLRDVRSADAIADLLSLSGTYISRGLGRSYGDVCTNSEGSEIDLSQFNHYLDFDEKTGVLIAEAGLSLRDIQRHFVPRGWALKVTPGTQFVTLGGAVANDIHGKSHHVDGTFSHHVVGFSLLRSNGRIIECSPEKNSQYFAATIGGIGLTGVILSVAVKLYRIKSALYETKTIPFASLSDWFALSDESDAHWSNSVSWIDCTSKRGKGLLMVGERSEKSAPTPYKDGITFPFTPPVSLINPLSVKLLNIGYFALGRMSSGAKTMHYEKFFYPLDGINNWNRAYGPRGFYQYQSVIPAKDAKSATEEMLREIRRSGQGSFLAVLKKFGSKQSLGMLSFPIKGTTLALDFPNRGADTLALFERLDAIVSEAGGRLYLAKDARMSREMFERTYTNIDAFKKLRDPKLSSDMSRRLLGK